MGKSKKRNRRQALFDGANYNGNKAKQRVTATDGNNGMSDDDEDEDETMSAEAIATTIRTLNYLVKHPDEFQSKEYKDIRRAVHPLVLKQVQSYDKGVDYRLKVTHHLSKQQWACALAALQGVKDYHQASKQGTIQRWVRFVDLCDDGPVKIQLLGYVLSTNSTTTTTTTNSNNKHDPTMALISAVKQQQQNEEDTVDGDTGLKILEGWKIPSSPCNNGHSDEMEECNRAIHHDDDLLPLKTDLKSKIIYRESGSERKPPNHYDLLLHTTEPGTAVSFCQSDSLPNAVVKHHIPFVQGGFVLSDVLTSEECVMFRAAASTLAYRPDHPTSLENPTGIDSCEWLIDDHIHSTLFQRVKNHLPPIMGELIEGSTQNKHLYGINRRWRFFRYSQGCVYRPHIDGSWPSCYLSTKKDGTPTYEVDQTGATKSYFTLLIYLNDNFQGGETRFYYPDETAGGINTTLLARGVIPKEGSVLIFPQGNTASLLHEGSPVINNGTKYVVRMDVLYSSSNTDT